MWLVVQVAIDSTCATVAEVRKRGDDFWGEFEFYLSDLLVGLVMDVVLVGLMAPTAVVGRARPVATGGMSLPILPQPLCHIASRYIFRFSSCRDGRASHVCVDAFCVQCAVRTCTE